MKKENIKSKEISIDVIKDVLVLNKRVEKMELALVFKSQQKT